jgi:hypothetical protein
MAKVDGDRGGAQMGVIKSVDGSSMALNGQKGEGGMKPSASGNHNPGGTHPGKEGTTSVPIA